MRFGVFLLRFEAIHPFQDGNGRVGRLLLFKECLAQGIVPFIITEKLRWYYYRGLQNWPQVEGYLLDTCLAAQDEYKALLQYFRVESPLVLIFCSLISNILQRYN